MFILNILPNSQLILKGRAEDASEKFWIYKQRIDFSSCYVNIEFQNLHTILEPIVDKVEQTVEVDKVEEVVKKVVENVEEVVEKVVEKVEGSDKVEELVDKVVAKDDDVVTKLEQIVDNFKGIIQIEEKLHPLNLSKGKANEIDLDPAVKKMIDFRQWFEKRLDDAIQAADKENPRKIELKEEVEEKPVKKEEKRKRNITSKAQPKVDKVQNN